MAKLGSIYGEQDGSGPKGQDLHWAVRVPPEAVGHTAGCRVRVPRELPGGGLRHQRVRGPGDDGDQLTLHLPPGMPPGATLRLRGHGAAGEGGRPGDLMVKVSIGLGDEGFLGLVAPARRSGRDANLYVALAVGVGMVAALVAALLCQ